jgi:hypothetical protein
MSGGPFRDTLTPLIAHAQRELAELRQQRATLETELANARLRQQEDRSGNPPAARLRLRGLVVGLMVGAAFALLIIVAPR